jgi:hypothetical protein
MLVGKLPWILTRKLTGMLTGKQRQGLRYTQTAVHPAVQIHPLRSVLRTSQHTSLLVKPVTLFIWNLVPKPPPSRPRSQLPDQLLNQPPKLLPVTKWKSAMSPPLRHLARNRSTYPATYMYT